MPSKNPLITPGQGLLLLIDHYRDDEEKSGQLKKLYLSGASDAESCIALCDFMLNEPLMSQYDIAIDEKSINDDPSRRYFETHLAYETLKNQLNHISAHDLAQLFKASEALIDFDKFSDNRSLLIRDVLNGHADDPYVHRSLNKQFSYYINALKTGAIFSEPVFSLDDRRKILWLVRITYIGMVNGSPWFIQMLDDQQVI